jgi:hypothetical protein
MIKYRREFRRVHRSVWGAVALLILLGFLLQNVAGSAYYSLLMEASMAVSSAPVELQAGTAGNSTIYTNGTSAKVSVKPLVTGTDVEDYVDNNTWDEDGIADKGTHSNFTAQQYGPDLVNDTLTEENTGNSEWLDCNAFDATYDGWDTKIGSSPYVDAQDQPTNYIGEKNTVAAEIGWFDFPNTSLTGTLNVNISIYCNNDDGTGDDWADVIVDYTGSGAGTDVGNVAQHIGWQYDTIDLGSRSVSEVNNLRVRFTYQSSAPNDDVRIDHVRIGVKDSDNYELDLEVQWTSVDYDESNEFLCIYGGSIGTENITVDVWNGSDWENLHSDLDSGWKNVSVSSYLDSSNFTIRFKGGNETSDTTQTTWDIDAALLHVWTGASGTDVEDYVDNNTSDADNSTDRGTHSNFTAQQYGPDLVNDTLTEENTGGNGTLWLYVNADDEIRTDWTRVGTNPYLDAIDYPTNFVNVTGNNMLVGDFNFTDSGKSTETINSVTVQLNATQSQNNCNLEVFVWDGTSWTSLDVVATPTSWGWMNWTATTELNTWTKIDGAKIYIKSRSATGTYEVDCARLKVDYTAPDNYKLDLEIQWTNVDYDESNEKLCIYGGSMGAENITVNVWNGSSWENLFNDLDPGWNNASVGNYLTTSNFTIQFKGNNETSDTTQTTWDIDAALLHVWAGQDFNYVLKLVEKDNSNWTIRLKAYDNSSLSRFTNCSIYIYDGSNSTQIIILNGAYNQQTGPWYDLNASDTEYIWMHVETSSAGTSYIYTYLEIRVPNSTVYARYTITFKIT